MIGIFNGFKCMADIDILNKVKHKNNNTKWKYGYFKVKLSIYLNFINFFLEDLNFAFVVLHFPIALTTRDNRFHLFKS